MIESRHDTIRNLLESIIMHSPRIHAASLNQSFAVSDEILLTHFQLEFTHEHIDPKSLKTFQIALIHHNFKYEAKLIASFSDCVHPTTEKLDKLNVIW